MADLSQVSTTSVPVFGPIVKLPPQTTTESTQTLWHIKAPTKDDSLPVMYRTGIEPVKGQTTSTFSPTKVYSNVYRATDTIDVINNFAWTKSPISSRNDVPYIRLTEKRITTNSNISNLANSVFTLGGEVTTGINTVKTLFSTQAGSNLGPNSVPNNNETLQDNPIQVVIDKLQEASKAKWLQNAKDSLVNFTNNNFDNFSNPSLTPYNYLYATEPTGFVYKFPYFGNNYNDVRTSFGDLESNLISGLAGSTRDLAEGIAGITNFLKPGTYIEKSKQYSMGDSGRSIEIKFPLLNTGNYGDISKNWQLIFGLIYQNRPGRVTRAIIDVPVIYEVYSPGLAYMPYAFINSISVQFLGSRRNIKLDVPIGTSPNSFITTIETVVPDAYEVTIGLEGLNEESRNFLYSSIAPYNVTVGAGGKVVSK